MDKKYTKLDLERLLNVDLLLLLDGCYTVDGTGIWLLNANAPEVLRLSKVDRDVLLAHPERNANLPVLPFPFSIEEFLRFSSATAFELPEFFTFADGSVDGDAIDRLKQSHAPAWELAKALMFDEFPRAVHPDAGLNEAASACDGLGTPDAKRRLARLRVLGGASK